MNVLAQFGHTKWAKTQRRTLHFGLMLHLTSHVLINARPYLARLLWFCGSNGSFCGSKRSHSRRKEVVKENQLVAEKMEIMCTKNHKIQISINEPNIMYNMPTQ